MNKVGAFLVVIGVGVGSTLLSLGSTVVAAGITGRYLVQFDDGTDPDLEAAALRAGGIDVVEVYRGVFAGVAVRAAASVIDELLLDPAVARVEADQVITIDAAESFSQPIVTQTAPPSWGLDRIDQRLLPLSNSYSYNGAGAGVTAYIVDSGIRPDHVEFGGRVRPGFTTVFDGFGTNDCPAGVGTGHGTHVAGTVGGQTFGVAKSVSLVAVRVLDCAGSTNEVQLLDALDWVIADHPAGAPAVVNLSLGGPPSVLLDRAVQAVIDDGVTVAVAAGNAQPPSSAVDACTGSPARATNALTVAASSETDARSLVLRLRAVRRSVRARRQHSVSLHRFADVGGRWKRHVDGHAACRWRRGGAAVRATELDTGTSGAGSSGRRNSWCDHRPRARHAEHAAVLRADHATGQRSVRLGDRFRRDEPDRVDGQQRRRNDRTG